jgi:D-glycero-D-manno-heptose 1,7-bisphosphate phosphatase
MPDPAVFVDRDGTVIRERDYLSDPADVELLPGAAEALRAFQDAGYAVVIVTNQSGIARGYYGEADYRAVAAEVERRLRAEGVEIRGAYHCPHHPDITGPCRCRKPAPGMFEEAAADHDLALDRSVYIGDRVRDIAPGLERGGTGVLVRTGYGEAEAVGAPSGAVVVEDLAAAARRLLGSERH